MGSRRHNPEAKPARAVEGTPDGPGRPRPLNQGRVNVLEREQVQSEGSKAGPEDLVRARFAGQVNF